MTGFRNYCLECNWNASTDNHSRDELAALAIEHAVSTGHDIDSECNPESSIDTHFDQLTD